MGKNYSGIRLPPPRAGAGELGYCRGSAESSPNSSILAPGSAFVPWALRGQVALVGPVLAPPGTGSGNLGPSQHNSPHPLETTIPGEDDE